MRSQRDPMKIKFPLWAYFNQKLFSSTSPFILDPLKFQQNYQVSWLEKCWDFDAIQQLESSWKQELNSRKFYHRPVKE